MKPSALSIRFKKTLALPVPRQIPSEILEKKNGVHAK